MDLLTWLIDPGRERGWGVHALESVERQRGVTEQNRTKPDVRAASERSGDIKKGVSCQVLLRDALSDEDLPFFLSKIIW